MLATVGFVWLFVVDAATTLLCALVLIRCFGFQRYSKTKSVEEQKAAETAGTGSPRRRTARSWRFSRLTLLTSLVFFQIHVTYPLYLSDHYGLSKPAIGLIYGVNTVVIVLVEMLLLDFVRGWPFMRMIGWGAFLSCLGFGMLAVRKDGLVLRAFDVDDYRGRNAVDAIGFGLDCRAKSSGTPWNVHELVHDELLGGGDGRTESGQARSTSRIPTGCGTPASAPVAAH